MKKKSLLILMGLFLFSFSNAYAQVDPTHDWSWYYYKAVYRYTDQVAGELLGSPSDPLTFTIPAGPSAPLNPGELWPAIDLYARWVPNQEQNNENFEIAGFQSGLDFNGQGHMPFFANYDLSLTHWYPSLPISTSQEFIPIVFWLRSGVTAAAPGQYSFLNSDINYWDPAEYTGENHIGQELYQKRSLNNVVFTVTPNTSGNAVPEPATMLLFGTGLAGFIWKRRKN